MKYLITGLGNPGSEYADTRHNIGFMVVDALAAAHDGVFQSDRYGHTCTIRVKGRHIVLLKPNTYMNLSGKALRHHLQAQDIPAENSLTITDDINLPFGSIRIRPSGSNGGHNGLGSIQEILGHTNYPRMRVGVGNNFPKGGQVDYVLAPFSPEEQSGLTELIKRCGDASISFVFAGLARTMTQYNK